MEVKIYTVYDMKTESYHRPQVFRNDADAIRTMSLIVNDSNNESLLALSPTDFVLYRIGSFDDETGFIVSGEHELAVQLQSLVKVKSHGDAS